MNPSDALREALEAAKAGMMQAKTIVREEGVNYWLVNDETMKAINAALAAPVSVADVIEGEVDQRAIAFLAHWYDWQGDPLPWWNALTDEQRARAAIAALRSQVVRDSDAPNRT